jgi:hypothetical protein
LKPEERDRLDAKLVHLQKAVEAEPKSRAWRLRAKLGTRRRWHDTVEEQD